MAGPFQVPHAPMAPGAGPFNNIPMGPPLARAQTVARFDDDTPRSPMEDNYGHHHRGQSVTRYRGYHSDSDNDRRRNSRSRSKSNNRYNKKGKNQNGKGSRSKVLYKGYDLEKADPKDADDDPNWSRAGKTELHFDQKKLQSLVKAIRKQTGLSADLQLKKLSVNQQGLVNRLIEEKKRKETDRYADWSIAAVLRDGKWKSFTKYNVNKVRVIIKRQDIYDFQTTAKGSSSKSRRDSRAFHKDDIIDLEDNPRRTGGGRNQSRQLVPSNNFDDIFGESDDDNSNEYSDDDEEEERRYQQNNRTFNQGPLRNPFPQQMNRPIVNTQPIPIPPTHGPPIHAPMNGPPIHGPPIHGPPIHGAIHAPLNGPPIHGQPIPAPMNGGQMNGPPYPPPQGPPPGLGNNGPPGFRPPPPPPMHPPGHLPPQGPQRHPSARVPQSGNPFQPNPEFAIHDHSESGDLSDDGHRARKEGTRQSRSRSRSRRKSSSRRRSSDSQHEERMDDLRSRVRDWRMGSGSSNDTFRDEPSVFSRSPSDTRRRSPPDSPMTQYSTRDSGHGGSKRPRYRSQHYSDSVDIEPGYSRSRRSSRPYSPDERRRYGGGKARVHQDEDDDYPEGRGAVSRVSDYDDDRYDYNISASRGAGGRGKQYNRDRGYSLRRSTTYPEQYRNNSYRPSRQGMERGGRRYT